MPRFGKPSPGSIHDVDTPAARAARAGAEARSRRRRRLIAGAASLAVVAGGTGFALTQRGGDSIDRADRATSILAEKPSKNPADAHVALLMDGWSYRTLGDRPVYANANGTPAAVDFQPATEADLAELLATTPGLVTEVMARLVTDDPTLKCTTTGCRTASGPVTAAKLLYPASVPVLGDSYRGYGIGSGLYVARVATGGSTGSVELTATGYKPTLVSATPVPATQEGTSRKLEPDAANGYLRARYLVGAGLGRLFAVDAQWPGTGAEDPVRYVTRPTYVPGTDDAGTATSGDGLLARVRDQNTAGVAAGGLAASFEPAADWSTGHLTYATSPTTGCGPEALCVPTRVKVNTVRDVRDFVEVCAPEGTDRGVAALHDTVLELRLPTPTHQFGLGDGGRWGAKPTLVDGPVRLRMGVLGLFDAASVKSARAAGGRVDAGTPAPIRMADALAGIRFDGVHWQSC